MDTWDKIIEEQERIQGKNTINLISEVAEGIDQYGDSFFD